PSNRRDVASLRLNLALCSKLQLPDRISRPAQSVEAHLGIFAREQHARSLGLQCSQNRLLHTLPRAFAVVRLGRNVDVDAWPDQRLGARNTLDRTLGFSRHIIR